jgi:hypothetical protein
MCLIGDDDQNIYAFRGASNKFLLQFEEEYAARRVLLTENYRSTEPIIEASNRLIGHNKDRCKKAPGEQVRIDRGRHGGGGRPVESWRFAGVPARAAWVCARVRSWLAEETGATVRAAPAAGAALPDRLVFLDLDPGDVHLGHPETQRRQQRIQGLLEGAPLRLRVSTYGDGWLICADDGLVVGALSRSANQDLRRRGLGPGQFQFAAGEVRVSRVFRHLKFDEVSGKKLEDWFVVVPQIRVGR